MTAVVGAERTPAGRLRAYITGNVTFLLEAHPDLDPAAYAEELVTVFDLGTR
jgi:hypothetical protein